MDLWCRVVVFYVWIWMDVSSCRQPLTDGILTIGVMTLDRYSVFYLLIWPS